jgi:hypothetical protein
MLLLERAVEFKTIHYAREAMLIEAASSSDDEIDDICGEKTWRGPYRALLRAALSAYLDVFDERSSNAELLAEVAGPVSFLLELGTYPRGDSQAEELRERWAYEACSVIRDGIGGDYEFLPMIDLFLTIRRMSPSSRWDTFSLLALVGHLMAASLESMHRVADMRRERDEIETAWIDLAGYPPDDPALICSSR